MGQVQAGSPGELEACVGTKIAGRVFGSLRGECELSASAMGLEVTAGKSRFRLDLLNTEEFPAEPEVKGEVVEVRGLGQSIARVQFAARKYDDRPALNAVLVELVGGVARCVATDGHRMAVYGPDGEAEYGWLIPRDSASVVASMFQGNGSVEAIFDPAEAKDISLSNMCRWAVARHVSYRFPDYTSVMPRPKGWMELGLEEFRKALKFLSPLAGSGLVVLECDGKGEVSLGVEGGSTGSGSVVLEEFAREGSFRAGFNVAYMLAGVNCPGERVRIGYVDPESAFLVQIAGDDLYRYVVMPIRVG